MSKTPPTFRALDLGFGFTKFSKGHYLQDGSLEVSAFPSYAAAAVNFSIGAGVMTDLSIVKVSVDDEHFLVGEDVRNAADGVGRQMLESTFFTSSQYIALARGAMGFMNVPNHGEVDSLVMGLPLNIFRDQSIVDHVEAAMKGTHLVPDITKNSGVERTILVKNVSIIPQVVGSLVAMSRDAGLMQKVNEQHNLTIDVGYGTLLWLVSDGFTPVPARSNGNMGGVSSLLQKIIRSIDPSAVSSINIMDRLDKALLEDKASILINGAEVEVAKYHRQLASAARENLTEMIRSIGTKADIDNVFLTGGGAHLYKDAIAAVFPGRQVHIASKGSRFTNVRGFQFLAETED
ncbi:ParM/StbA family protein [Rhodoferax ferrireducens]|nr:ParM/StbA family protein [Rhodoferax ferrireducens]